MPPLGVDSMILLPDVACLVGVGGCRSEGEGRAPISELDAAFGVATRGPRPAWIET